MKEFDLSKLTSEEVELLIWCVQRCRIEVSDYKRSLPYRCSELLEHRERLRCLQVVLTGYAQSHGISYTLDMI